MYCPSCGKEVNSGLSYCNYCGVRLTEKEESDPNALAVSSFNLLVGAVLAIPVVGLVIIIMLMAVMKNGLNFRDDMIGLVVFMSFVLLLVAETGCMWMMISRTKKRKVRSPKEHRAITSNEINKIDDVVAKGLNAPTFDGFPSVTEHTTRTLDAVRRKTGDE